MNIKIVQGKSSDWKGYKKLRLESLKECPIMFGSLYEEEVKYSDKKWQERIKSKSGFTLLARDNKDLIGTISCFWNIERLSTRHIANVVGVYVILNYRGQGIGKMLLKSLLEKLKTQKEIKKIKITVNTLNQGAIALYEKSGFQKIGILKKEIKINNQYYDEYLMEKILL